MAIFIHIGTWVVGDVVHDHVNQFSDINHIHIAVAVHITLQASRNNLLNLESHAGIVQSEVVFASSQLKGVLTNLQCEVSAKQFLGHLKVVALSAEAITSNTIPVISILSKLGGETEVVVTIVATINVHLCSSKGFVVFSVHLKTNCRRPGIIVHFTQDVNLYGFGSRPFATHNHGHSFSVDSECPFASHRNSKVSAVNQCDGSSVFYHLFSNAKVVNTTFVLATIPVTFLVLKLELNTGIHSLGDSPLACVVQRHCNGLSPIVPRTDDVSSLRSLTQVTLHNEAVALTAHPRATFGLIHIPVNKLGINMQIGRVIIRLKQQSSFPHII